MTTQKDELDIRDTLANPGQIQDMRKVMEGLLKIVNGLDKDVTVTIDSTSFEDKGFSAPIETHELLVAAGESDYLVVDAPWAFVRPTGTCSIVPTTGTLVFTWEFKEKG